MCKKHFSLILIFFLIFISIPVSFAANGDISIENIVNDNDYISENESVDISYDEIHVAVNGSDDNTGLYNSPLSTIKKAINLSLNNSKIIIHSGVYRENDLNITKSLKILGKGNVIIDAEGKSRIFTINTGTQDNVVLSGLTFINGEAYQGGAIYVRNAVTTINNSKFINNTALAEGGAIYWNSDYGRLTNTLIEGNVARDGSGVSWGGINSTFTGGDFGEIINCIFSNNHITQDEDACVGLSIYSNNAKVINSTFINHNVLFNSSFEVLYINGDYSIVEGCLFANNSMTLTGALGFDGNYASAFNNIFINNSVSFNDSFGGAIGLQSETANIYNNTFINNGGDGCVGGAIFINSVETFSFNFINITNNSFVNNMAFYGGDIYVDGKNNMLSVLIENNTFNSSRAVNGASVYLYDIYNPVSINNNLFLNLLADVGCGIYANSCIVSLLNNSMKNCTSLNGGVIYSNGDIYSNLKLKFSDIVCVLNQPTTLSAILSDDMNNTISTNSISFNVDGVNVGGTKGINNITAIFNTTGTYVLSGSFDRGIADVENATLKIMHGANLNINNVSVFGKSVPININLTDIDGNPISNANIILNLNGNKMLITTDMHGIAFRNITLDGGVYNITAVFDDNVYYKSVNTTFTVNVYNSIVSVNMIRAYNSSLDFKAQLFNFDGSPLTNTSVTLNINSKNYTIITNLEGYVNLDVKLGVGVYNVIVTNPITGDISYNTLKIVKRIGENKNLNAYFGLKPAYKIRLYGDNGGAVGAGEIVVIKILSKTYKIKTNKNGYASFKIDLNPKTYVITASYKGFKVSNKIIIKPVLTAKNISKKKSKKIKFKAKLVNTKGKAVKDKKITFKIKGKTYHIKTNKKGIANLYLSNLKVGKYQIITKYGKSLIRNIIKIKK